MTEIYHFRAPAAPEIPLLVSIPHTGTEVPDAIAARFASDEVRALPDTDWHLHDLYSFVPELGGATIYARFSRFVVDLNRPADGAVLYPGRDETGVVPTSTFSGQPIYADGNGPDDAEVAERCDRYWRPYHDRLRAELDRLRDKFGYALLFDAHSIMSVVPRFFDGTLPGLMLGDVDGTSAAPEISAAVLRVHDASGISYRANAPFKGGYITRAFGCPSESIHALQLEMSQRLYMDEGPPFAYRSDLAERLVPTLLATLEAFVDTARRP